MTELSNIVAAERRLELLHPATQEPVGLVLVLLPDSHLQVKAAARKSINDRISHRGKVSAEQLEASRIGMLAASVGGWEWQGELTFHGSKPEFNPQTLQQLLKELPWVTSLTAASMVFGIQLAWAFPPGATDTERTEIWRSPGPSLESATKLGDFAYPQNRHRLDGLAAGAKFYFWGRLVDRSGNIGPWYPAGAGVVGESSTDVAEYDAYFSGLINKSALRQELLSEIESISSIVPLIWDADATYEAGQTVVRNGKIWLWTDAPPAMRNRRARSGRVWAMLWPRPVRWLGESTSWSWTLRRSTARSPRWGTVWTAWSRSTAPSMRAMRTGTQVMRTRLQARSPR
ncbi:TPA: hypothetical protein UL918_000780 [Stenotrophomonas maltophilia]|nr:hypothetical protein [Stenotrophomonas maltophilia]